MYDFCDKCDNILSECTCNEMCWECDRKKSECICDKMCWGCESPLSECTCTCSYCGKLEIECNCENEVCEECGRPLRMCRGHYEDGSLRYYDEDGDIIIPNPNDTDRYYDENGDIIVPDTENDEDMCN